MGSKTSSIILLLMTFMSEGWTIKQIKLQNFAQFRLERDALIHILKSCDREYETVIVINDNDGGISKSLFTQPSLTSVILSDENMFPLIIKKPIQVTRKIDAFIGKSLNQLTITINIQTKPSWWNVNTPYFVIEKINIFSLNNPPIFVALDDRQIFELYFIVLDMYGSITVITVNPFAAYSSSQWKQNQFFSTLPIFFNRSYNEENICQGFYFDRLKELENHYINIMAIRRKEDVDVPSHVDTDEGVEYFTKRRDWYINIFKSSINMIMWTALDHPTIVFDKTGPDEYYPDELNEIYFWSLPTHQSSYTDEMFPIHFYRLNFLVQHRGYKTPFEKIGNYYSICICLSLILVLCIIFIVFKFTNRKKDFAFTSLEVLRFLINTAIVTPLNFNSLRIFISTIFLYFFILNATFSGFLVEILTKRGSCKNLEMFRDWNDSQYDVILVPQAVPEYFAATPPNSKVVFYKDISECIFNIVQSEEIICAYKDYSFKETPRYFEHDSGTTLYKLPVSFDFNYQAIRFRKQSRLKSRFDFVLMRVLESGLNEILRTGKKKDILSKMQKQPPEIFYYSSINLEMLTFAFVILGIGFVCAVMSFIVEILLIKE